MELTYALCLFSGLLLSYPIRLFQPGTPRKLYTSLVGLAYLLILSKAQIYHWVVMAVGSFLLLLPSQMASSPTKRNPGWLIFFFAFAYQGFIRFLSLKGIYPLDEGANMVLLMLTLKVVAFGVDIGANGGNGSLIKPVANGETANETAGTEETANGCERCAWMGDYWSYLLFFPGVWSGPFLFFDDVRTCLNSPSLRMISPVEFIKKRVLWNIPVFINFLVIPRFFSLAFPLTSKFDELGIINKLFYLHMLCVAFRARYLSAWLVSEVTCALAGVGVRETVLPIGDGQKDGEKPENKTGEIQDKLVTMDPNSFNNFNALTVETAEYLKDVIRNWNCGVQRWMVFYVYKRSPLKNRLARQLFVMVVSAYWHGLNWGYYGSFFCYPILQYVQEYSFHFIDTWKIQFPGKAMVSSAIKRIGTGLMLSFCGLPFMYLNWRDGITVWRKAYFFGLALAIIFAIAMAITRAFQPPKPRHPQNSPPTLSASRKEKVKSRN